MARTFVRVSLGTKFRVLFAMAVPAVIAVALGVPWYFTEQLVDQAAEQAAEQITQLGLAEWVQRHPPWYQSRRASTQPGPEERARPHPIKARPKSDIADYFTAGGRGRRGPTFVPLTPAGQVQRLDGPARRAVAVFREERLRTMAVLPAEDEEGRRVYRCFRAARVTAACARCHDGVAAEAFQPGQFVGLIDVTMPPPTGALIWWSRCMFILGGTLAALLAFLVFYFMTRQIILAPVRKLRDLADDVADGDLTKRVELTTGDEFERLGRRFNEMLDAITTQQDRLRQANRALDLRLGELAEANVALYEANRIKNEFLANVSHELRTPLNSIIGFAELLAETDDEKRRRHATHILTSARMLLGIINDLLDVARIEAGRTEVRYEKVSITDLCETLAQLARPLADKSRLQLSVELAEQIPLVRTDPGKVQQILYNLLSNAIKFTPAGGRVTLSARPVAAADSPLQSDSVAVSLADTGPGIPAADQQRIFEKFYRMDNVMIREHGGAGLGLAIARELTDLLGGRLTLDSEPGHGATFTVLLPISPREAKAGETDARA